MVIHCPKCNEELELPDDAVGRKFQCFYCKEKFFATEDVVRGQEMFGEGREESESVDWESLSAQEEADRQWDARKTAWKDSILINCPKCNANVTLETALLGSKVRCPCCDTTFLARGEGAMVTEDRDRCRDAHRLEEEAQAIRSRLCWESESMTALKIAFKVGGYGCEIEGDNLCLNFWFEENFDIMGLLDHFKSLVESIIGFKLKFVDKTNDNFSDGFVVAVRYYVLRDVPCKQIEQAKRERVRVADEAGINEDALVFSRKEEENRILYLVNGDEDEKLYSRNYFCFIDYLREKYDKLQILRIIVLNYPAFDSFCKLRGLKDGFGIVVEVKSVEGLESVPDMIKDMEKRFSRKLTLVKKIDGSIIEYCFTVSTPNQGSVTQSRIAIGQGRNMNERTATMKHATTSVPQHLGKGTRVDWSQENKAFAEMIARHGIKKFHVEMANPYCAEISIPMNVNENTVRKFANDLFHELDVLDADYELDFGQHTDCSVLDMNEDARCYYVVFNHHDVKDTAPGDAMYKYKMEAISAGLEDDEDDDSDEPASGELTPAQIMKYIANGIKSGEFKSRSGEGYFVLKGEFFDAIKAGRKTAEYRDLSPRNLSKSIGIKTVKLQRGYGHPGQPPEQMRFEVKSVGLLNANDRECDPYNIPDGFIATTIAIHLGRRIG